MYAFHSGHYLGLDVFTKMINKLNVRGKENEHHLRRCPRCWLPVTAPGVLFCFDDQKKFFEKKDGIPVSLHYLRFQI